MDKLECLLRTDTSRSAVWIGEDTIAYLRQGTAALGSGR